MSQEFAQLDQSVYDESVPTQTSEVSRPTSRPVPRAGNVAAEISDLPTSGGGGGPADAVVAEAMAAQVVRAARAAMQPTEVTEEMDREMRRGGGPNARAWVATIHVASHDPEVQAQRAAWRPVLRDPIRYFIGQLECCPTTGQVHWQCYMQLKGTARHQAVRRALGASWAWLQPAMGTAEQCRAYCSKEDTRVPGEAPIELGELNGRQGKRNDLDVPADMIKQGKRMLEIAEMDPVAYIRNHKGFHALDALHRRKRAVMTFRQLRVIVIWGPPGTGKTRWVYDNFDRSEIYALTVGASEQTWWDGYDGHKVLLMDDFLGQLKWNFVLRVLDGHPLQMPVKGSMTYAEFDTVCITSNLHWSEWYRKDETGRREVRALQRRITEVRYLPAPGAEWQVQTRSDDADVVTGQGLVPIPDPPAMAPGFSPGM